MVVFLSILFLVLLDLFLMFCLSLVFIVINEDKEKTNSQQKRSLWRILKDEWKNNAARFIIILSSSICLGGILAGVLCYFTCVSGEKMATGSYAVWYNFISPLIAIINVIAFIGLTVAIYKGESDRQRKHEQVNIQNTIITKLQIIEKELAQIEQILRGDKACLQDIYTAYIILYRHTHYFDLLPNLSILSQREQEKQIAKEVLDRIKNTRDILIQFYNDHKAEEKFLFTHEMKHDLAYHINYLTAHLEEFEISIIQDISLTIEEPKS